MFKSLTSLLIVGLFVGAVESAWAYRVISLAPHLTENLFTIGAGHMVVGTVSHSDYPAEARGLPSVGDSRKINIEAVYALRPDWVISWRQGTSEKQLQKLRDLGINVLVVNSNRFTDIAKNMRQFGEVLGVEDAANRAADEMLATYNRIVERYKDKPRLPVFYQLWHEPLMTVNDTQLLHQMMMACGAKNLFGDQPMAIPKLNVEAVIAAQPEVIITSLEDWSDLSWIDRWQPWKMIPAVKNQAFVTLDADITYRPTRRALQGTEQLCNALDQYRH